MNDDDLGPATFTEEESLWQIYRKARRIRSSPFNLVTTLIVLVVVSLGAFFSKQPAEELIRLVRELASFGMNSTLTVLGFLVAGFTIFASVTNPYMLIRMGSVRHDESGLSWMKHSFFVLIRAFIYFVCYAVFCFFIVYLGAKGGVASVLISISPHPEAYRICVAKLAFVILAVGQFFLLMQLKSFIFNMYHSVVASLQWKAEGGDS